MTNLSGYIFLLLGIVLGITLIITGVILLNTLGETS